MANASLLLPNQMLFNIHDSSSNDSREFDNAADCSGDFDCNGYLLKFDKWKLHEDRDVYGDVVVTYSVLCGKRIIGFENDGEPMLYFPQVLQMLQYPNAGELHQVIEQLAIPLVHCALFKMRMLWPHIRHPNSSSRSLRLFRIENALIAQTNAERLCKIYWSKGSSTSMDVAPMDTSLNMAASVLRQLLLHEEAIPIAVDCTLHTSAESVEDEGCHQQKGLLLPQLYTLQRSDEIGACIICLDCCNNPADEATNTEDDIIRLLTPEQFVRHSHYRNTGSPSATSNSQPVEWGFSAVKNWTYYIRLDVMEDQNDDMRSASTRLPQIVHQQQLKHKLDLIKQMHQQQLYNQQSMYPRSSPNPDSGQPGKSDASSTGGVGYHHSGTVSLNTSPSMPTPSSLSPSESIHKNTADSNCQNNVSNQLQSFWSDKWSLLISSLLQLNQEKQFTASLFQQELFKAVLAATLINSAAAVSNAANNNNTTSSAPSSTTSAPVPASVSVSSCSSTSHRDVTSSDCLNAVSTSQQHSSVSDNDVNDMLDSIRQKTVIFKSLVKRQHQQRQNQEQHTQKWNNDEDNLMEVQQQQQQQ